MKLLNQECVKEPDEGLYDFQLHNCGFFKNIENPVPTFRKDGRRDYHIIIIKKGRLKANLMGKVETATDGSVVFLPPQVPHIYTYYPEDSNNYFWVHFDGTLMEKILSFFPLQTGIYRVENVDELSRIAFKIYKINLKHIKADGLLMNSLTAQLVISFCRDVFCRENESPAQKKLSNIISNIDTFPEKNFNISSAAAECGVSEYHFIRIFKERTGLTPVQYVISGRIGKAKMLLRETDMAVSQVAFMCGFTDPLYFSRLYKSKTGMSPKEYRGRN